MQQHGVHAYKKQERGSREPTGVDTDGAGTSWESRLFNVQEFGELVVKHNHEIDYVKKKISTSHISLLNLLYCILLSSVHCRRLASFLPRWWDTARCATGRLRPAVLSLLPGELEITQSRVFFFGTGD